MTNETLQQKIDRLEQINYSMRELARSENSSTYVFKHQAILNTLSEVNKALQEFREQILELNNVDPFWKHKVLTLIGEKK